MSTGVNMSTYYNWLRQSHRIDVKALSCCELNGGIYVCTRTLRRHQQRSNQPRGYPLYSRCGLRTRLRCTLQHRSVKEQRTKCVCSLLPTSIRCIPGVHSRVAPANRLNTSLSRMLIAPAATPFCQASHTRVSSFRCLARGVQMD